MSKTADLHRAGAPWDADDAVDIWRQYSKDDIRHAVSVLAAELDR